MHFGVDLSIRQIYLSKLWNLQRGRDPPVVNTLSVPTPSAVHRPMLHGAAVIAPIDARIQYGWDQIAAVILLINLLVLDIDFRVEERIFVQKHDVGELKPRRG